MSITYDEIIRALRIQLSYLTSRRENILKDRLGINGQPMTLEAIGSKYKFSKERARQLEVTCIQELSKTELMPILRKIQQMGYDAIIESGNEFTEDNLVETICKKGNIYGVIDSKIIHFILRIDPRISRQSNPLGRGKIYSIDTLSTD